MEGNGYFQDRTHLIAQSRYISCISDAQVDPLGSADDASELSLDTVPVRIGKTFVLIVVVAVIIKTEGQVAIQGKPAAYLGIMNGALLLVGQERSDRHKGAPLGDHDKFGTQEGMPSDGQSGILFQDGFNIPGIALASQGKGIVNGQSIQDSWRPEFLPVEQDPVTEPHGRHEEPEGSPVIEGYKARRIRQAIGINGPVFGIQLVGKDQAGIINPFGSPEHGQSETDIMAGVTGIKGDRSCYPASEISRSKQSGSLLVGPDMQSVIDHTARQALLQVNGNRLESLATRLHPLPLVLADQAQCAPIAGQRWIECGFRMSELDEKGILAKRARASCHT